MPKLGDTVTPECMLLFGSSPPCKAVGLLNMLTRLSWVVALALLAAPGMTYDIMSSRAAVGRRAWAGGVAAWVGGAAGAVAIGDVDRWVIGYSCYVCLVYNQVHKCAFPLCA